jgi:predicted AAA+ superfamily ATPase
MKLSVERDVRLVRNIGNLETFRRFLRLCAGRTGQLLSFTSLAGDAGIAVNTVKSWLGLLQAGWLIFLLPSWHQGISPSLFFWRDSTGREIDLVENPEGAGLECRIWECKSGLTVSNDFFQHLLFFGKRVGIPPESCGLPAQTSFQDEVSSIAFILL